MKPFPAAIKGAGEIGFTVISISISLVAVLIPLLMMSGIIGRLFREFSVTIAMTIGVSAMVALTLTPMMASRFLKAHDEEKHGRLYKLSERGFEAMANGYARGLDAALRHSFITLMIFLATVAATGYLFVKIPKGFFPQQDTGIIFGTTVAGAGRLVPRDVQIAGGGRRDRPGRPRRRHDGDGPGHRHRQRLAELRPHVHHAEAARGSRRRRVPGDQPAARRSSPRSSGVTVYLQAAQDVTVGARAALTQFQYTLQDANYDELNTWAPKILAKLQALPELRDVGTDQQSNGTTLKLKIDRDMASRFGIQPQQIDDTLYDAFGQRQVTQFFTQINTYYVVEEITPSLQKDPKTLEQLYIRSPSNGQLVPLSAFAKWTTVPVSPLSISHQGQFPAVTLSFNLAPGVALGQATAAIQAAEQEHAACPRGCRRRSRATRRRSRIRCRPCRC